MTPPVPSQVLAHIKLPFQQDGGEKRGVRLRPHPKNDL